MSRLIVLPSALAENEHDTVNIANENRLDVWWRELRRMNDLNRKWKAYEKNGDMSSDWWRGGDKKYKNTKIQIKKEWIEGRKWGVYVREKGVNGQEDKAPTVGSIEVENNGTSTG